MEGKSTTRIDTSYRGVPKPIYPTNYTRYKFDDPVTENRRRKEKFSCLRRIVKGLRVMEDESNNRFEGLNYEEQEDILEKRLNMPTEVLRTASLCPNEFNKLRGEVRKRIIDIYQQNMKFAIPVRFQH